MATPLPTEALSEVVVAAKQSGLVQEHALGAQRKAGTFVGSELVSLLSRDRSFAASRKEAAAVGQQLVDAGLAYNLSGEPRFSDDVSFYRFTDANAGYAAAARSNSSVAKPGTSSAANPVTHTSGGSGDRGGGRTGSSTRNTNGIASSSHRRSRRHMPSSSTGAVLTSDHGHTPKSGSRLAPIGSGRSVGSSKSASAAGSGSGSGGAARKALSPAEWMRSTSPRSFGSGGPPLTASPALFGAPISQQLGFQPSVTVAVTEAETREDSGGRYTAFRVVVHNSMRQWTVARRYSEFRALHFALSAEFPNTKLPKFPPKKFIGVMDPKFVAERRDALMRYVHELVEVPAVWQSNDLISFLDDSANSLGIQVTLERMQLRVKGLEQVCADHQHQLRRYDQLFRRQVQIMDKMKRRIVALESQASMQYTDQSVASALSAVSPPSSLQSGQTGVSVRTAPPTTGTAHLNVGSGGGLALLRGLQPPSTTVTSPHAPHMSATHGLATAVPVTAVAATAGANIPMRTNGGVAHPSPTPATTNGGGTAGGAGNGMAAGAAGVNSVMTVTSPLGDGDEDDDDVAPPPGLPGPRAHAAAARPLPTPPKAIVGRQRGALGRQPNGSPDAAPGSFQLPTPSSAMLKGIVTPPWRRRSDSNPWGGNSVALSVAAPDAAVQESSIPCNEAPTDVDRHVDSLLVAMQADAASLAKRDRVCWFVSGLLKKALGAQAFAVGPHPLSACLPEDELQLSAFLCHGQERTWFVKVSEVLCMASSGQASAQIDDGAAGGPNTGAASGAAGGGARRNRSRSRSDSSADRMAAALAGGGIDGGPPLPPSADGADAGGSGRGAVGPCTVTAVNFVNGATRRVKCSVDGVTVDVSANQLSDLCLVAVLEAVDVKVGRNHLFKRSVLLIKAWCTYESRTYAGWSAMSALPWRALATLLVWLFARRAAVIRQPLHALAWFLLDCSRFPWHSCALTIHGAVPLEQAVATAARRFAGDEPEDDGVDASPSAGAGAGGSDGGSGGDASVDGEGGRGVGVEAAVPDAALQRVMDPAHLRQLRRKCCRRHGVDVTAQEGGGIHDSASSHSSAAAAVGVGGSGDGDALGDSFAEVPPEEFAVASLNIADMLIPTRNLCGGLSRRQAGRVQQLLEMGVKNLAPVLHHAGHMAAAATATSGSASDGSAAVIDATSAAPPSSATEPGSTGQGAADAPAPGPGSTAAGTQPPSGRGWTAVLSTFFASSWQRFRSHGSSASGGASGSGSVASSSSGGRAPLPPSGGRGSSGGGGGGDDSGGAGAGAGGRPGAEFKHLEGNLETVTDNVNYCLFLLDAEVTAPALLSLATQILAEKGRLPVGEIGKLLQEATANSSLSSTLKEEFGGLKKFLENYPDTFLISNDHPFNPHVFLKSALSPEEIQAIMAGTSSALGQRRKKTSRRKKGGGGGGGGGGGHTNGHSTPGGGDGRGSSGRRGSARSGGRSGNSGNAAGTALSPSHGARSSGGGASGGRRGSRRNQSPLHQSPLHQSHGQRGSHGVNPEAPSFVPSGAPKPSYTR